LLRPAQVTGSIGVPAKDYPFATETLDVADAAQVARCAAPAGNIERLDVLVNAAGICAWARPTAEQEDWQQTFAVNVGGAFNLFQQTMASSAASRAGRSSPSPPMPRIRRASA
jgi:2,3-dihydro-2,3-dihydroxybenzoate dehydrogenase